MPKLPRVTAKIFASNAAENDIGQYGSALTGTKVTTSDISEIQALAAYEEGWRGAVISNRNYPTLQEMNGLQKTFSQQIAYCLENGMPEWDEGTTYYTNQFCRIDNTFYYSLIDNNQGNNPKTDTTSWNAWAPGESVYLGQRNISNNINSAPELVKWKLEDGVLTLLSGSIARWAAGTQAPTLNIGDLYKGYPIVDISWDGTRLVYYTQTQQDYSWTYNNYTGYVQMFLQDAENAPFWGLQTDMIYSGTNNTVTTDNRVFYDTDDNTCVHPRDNIAQSLPLMKCFLNGASGITTVCDTYQTGGCIGSTIWFNKNVSGNAVNKINSECGLASIEFTTEYDYFITFESTLTRYNSNMFSGKEADSDNSLIYMSSVNNYDVAENYIYNYLSGNSIGIYQCLIGTNLTIVNGQIQSYTPRMPFRAADAQDLSGQFMSSRQELFSGITFNQGETKTYSLANYLPKDGKVYEVFLNGYVRTGTVAGNSTGMQVLSDIVPVEGFRICRCTTRTTSAVNAAGTAIIPVGAARELNFHNVDANGVSGSWGCYLVGFRKVR